MIEIPKRLAPKIETLRELYLKCGNECAFPGCKHKMIESDGTFVGQICHIEAALPDGERFNPNQTNEERRAFNNLLLMCHRHHVITDNVKKYTVDKMKKIKEEHEVLFTDIPSIMQSSLVDFSELENIQNPKSLNKVQQSFGWNLSDEELQESILVIVELSERLKMLSRTTRALLVKMINRGKKGGVLISADLVITVNEIEKSMSLSEQEVFNHLKLMESYNIIRIDNDEYDQPLVKIDDLDCGWSIWSDLRTFCKKENINLAEIIVDLNFSLLD